MTPENFIEIDFQRGNFEIAPQNLKVARLQSEFCTTDFCRYEFLTKNAPKFPRNF